MKSSSYRFPSSFGALALSGQAFPVGMFYLVEVLLGLTDLAVVAALGRTELAAVGLARTVVFSYLTVGSAVLSASLVFLSEDPASRSRSEVHVAGLLSSVFLAAGGLALHRVAPLVLDAGGYSAPFVQEFSSYTRMLAWLVVPTAAYEMLKNAVVAAGRTHVLVPVSVGMVSANLVASVVLVHGAGWIPGLGVTGAAAATVAVNAGAAAALWVWCVRRGLLASPTVRLSFERILVHARRILQLGWPSGVQQALESVLFVIVLFFLGTFSQDWLVAGSIGFAVMEISYSIGTSFGEVTAARIARLGAEHDRAGQRRLVRSGIIACTLAATAFAAGVVIAAPSIVGLFAGADMTARTHAFVAEVLRWTCLFFVFDALQVYLTHTLRAVRCTVLPMAIGVASYWGIGLGGGLLLAFTAKLGAPALWGGFCAALAAAGIVLGVLTKSRFALLPRRSPDEPRGLRALGPVLEGGWR